MRRYYILLILLGQIFHTSLFAQQSTRPLAITIDDLPRQSVSSDGDYITTAILTALQKHQVQSVGFVNEGKLYDDEGQLQENRVSWLKSWIEAGQELGNHTYSHRSINTISVQKFTEEILKGEMVISQLRTDSLPLRYFRHPFLHKGNVLEKKDSLETALNELGYTEAPVTIDNGEWIYAAGYRKAMAEQDSNMAKKIGEDYLIYMLDKAEYYSRQSRKLFDRDISQVLLLHANLLNANYLDRLLSLLSNNGYTFVTLTTALTDKAYLTEDEYVGNAGISWLDRWALTRGKRGEFFANEPTVHQYVMEYSGIQSE